GPEAGSGGQPAAISGCVDGTSCASGVCGATHDCQNCVSDRECSAGSVCSAGQCAVACNAEEGSSQACGSGLTCCSEHCVSTRSDRRNCGACGTACGDTQFCGQSGCVVAKLSSACQLGKLAVVLDGQVGDDPTGRALSQALVTHCPSSQTSREVSQTVADVLNPSTGQPVSGGDELLLIAGGNYFQKGMAYLVANKLAPVVNARTPDNYELREAASNTLLASEPVGEASDSHDIFAVQLMREPISDSVILNAYGFSSEGTAAATYYFTDVLAPNLATIDKAWFVGEWTDRNADKLPASDELTILASGG